MTPARSPSPAVPAPPGGVRAWLDGEWLLAAFCVGVAAVALLYNLFSSPDVLLDEAAYTRVAQQVAQGWQLALDGQPLFVHPPLMFLVQAGWLDLTGHAFAPLSSAIRAARLLSALFGVANVLLSAALAYRLSGSATPRRRRVVTGLVALFISLDPVLVRYDRQDVIEPFALCVSLLVLYAAWTLRDRGALAYVSVTGLLGGLALLTNQITIFLVVVPPVFALLERNGPLIRRSFAALAIALALSLTFLLWAVELGQGRSFLHVQTATLQRLVGLVQITGLNMPGVSLTGSLVRSVTQYSSSYVVLASGFAALVWCWTRINTESGNFLTAWLTASYAVGGYIVAVGTLNEQFFVYLLPAAIVGSVMFADALIARWTSRSTRRAIRHRGYSGTVPRWALAIAAGGCTGMVGLSASSWITNYSGTSDGVVLADQTIAATLPACSMVNASGDSEKYSDLLPGYNFQSFSVGAAALAYGVHYFLLSPNDAIESNGNMTAALATWIQDHGRRLFSFPSQVYKTVQLWYVPASPYNAMADFVNITGGAYVNTVGSRCGGYDVTNGSQGSFYAGYQAMGGKSMVGDPLSRVTGSGEGGYEQLFDGAVLTDQPASRRAIRPLPIVAMLAERSPASYRRAALPPVLASGTVADPRAWLTNPAITHAYLDAHQDSPGAYAAAVQRYGEPLGPPSVQRGGEISQAFADVILQVPARGGTVHAATVTPEALAAGVLRIPASARDPQPAPPLPNTPSPPTPPSSAEPFVLTLAAVLLLCGAVVVMLAGRRPSRPRTSTAEPWWEEVA